jgi:hypothetical protein
MATRYHDVTVPLKQIGELFKATEYDPFDEDTGGETGIETIIETLKGQQLNFTTRATIILPPEAIRPGLEAEVRAAITRHCRWSIETNQREIDASRWAGIKGLQSGLFFLASCLLISSALQTVMVIPEFLRTFASEGLAIAGWVSLWHPVEAFLYDWWPAARQNEMYRHMIERMEITIKGAS